MTDKDKILTVVSNHFDERKPEIDNWRETTNYLKEKMEEEKMVLSIDEFPYLVESNKSILSYFQELTDKIDSNSTLILCGSSISIMESEVMGHKSPLYGRRTSQIDLQPFNFTTSLKVIDYPLKEAIRSYSITGGTPMYLFNFNYNKSLEENIKKKILNKSAFMYEEPEFLLRTELRNPKRYMGILETIAGGETRLNRISNTTGIEIGPLSNYIKTLRRLRLVRREIPITAERKKSKRSLYMINDNFFRFWFQFVEPKKSWIEEDPKAVLKEDIMPLLDEFTSKTFEEICWEATWKLNRKNIFQNKFSKIGRWWYRDVELDILGLNEKRNKALFGECKWTKNPVGYSEIKKLKEIAKKVKWRKDKRDENYILFSKSGFKEDLEEEEKVKLYDLKALEKIFTT